MDKALLTVLVTGIGGDLGQAIAKCLRLLDRPVRIVGSDTTRDTIGTAFADHYLVLPTADSETYLESLHKVCTEQEVDAVIPASVPEINALSLSKYLNQIEFKTPVANPRSRQQYQHELLPSSG